MRFAEVRLGDEAEIEALSRLATAIVREHFDPLIGKAQNDYMLKKFQSVPAICGQLRSGYRYFFACADSGERIGFLAFYPKGEALYLSKFYLVRQERGKGHSRRMLSFIASEARRLGLRAIELNVNKDNDAVEAYRKLGFKAIRREVNDIGRGFVMDDIVFRLDIDCPGVRL